jgi:hypothetical protein
MAIVVVVGVARYQSKRVVLDSAKALLWLWRIDESSG